MINRIGIISHLLLALILVCSAASPLRAQNLTPDEKTLVGIKDFRFLVEEPDYSTGIGGKDLATVVEFKLRIAGVKISKSFWAPLIHVTMTSTEIGGQVPQIVYYLRVTVRQDANLVRDPEIKAFDSATWETSVLGVVIKANAKQRIKNSLSELLDEFIAAYEKANGK